ncbi:ESPR-type extended signal peptide-containing protein, partial [Paraburkholderia kururiensis]|uniref:ESPR-type extended signal peptide-containing protein n=1 Tax=Paraburkholderia kururiensis TaxID=984307 RepID=UPI0022791218
MNKIYRTVWNESLGTYVAVSENDDALSEGRAPAVVLGGVAFQSSHRVASLSAISLAVIGAMAIPGGTLAQSAGGNSIYVNNSTDISCLAVVDIPQGAIMSGGFTQCNGNYSTQTDHVTFYGSRYSGTQTNSTDLSLGGMLYVNAGLIGVADNLTGTYSMRLGSQATLNGAAGGDAIAIGSAQTSTSDGSTSAATIASGARAVAIGSGPTANSADSVALGSFAYGSAADAIAVGRSASAAQSAEAIGGLASASAASSIAMGQQAIASGVNAIAIGKTAAATSTSSLAMGTGALSNAANAVAIGNTSTAAGGASVALGYQQTANGNGAVAIGDPNTATGTGAVAMGANNTATGNGAVALGETNLAGGAGAVAIGNTSVATTTGGVALGSAATAVNANDVALGSGSVTGSAVGTSGTAIGGKFYPFAGATPTSVVSVGSPGNERQISNVAAGQISASSTDAVNGSQLYAADQVITSLSSSTSTVGSSLSTVISGTNS